MPSFLQIIRKFRGADEATGKDRWIEGNGMFSLLRSLIL